MDADNHWDAVEAAVRQKIDRDGHAVLGPAVRVSSQESGVGPEDETMLPPYEDHFPGLFEDEDLAFTVAAYE